MAGAQIDTEAAVAAEDPTDSLLIDTDIHELMSSGRELLPYLDSYWQRWINEYGWNRTDIPSDFPYIPNVSTFRRSWVLEDGSGGTSLDALRAHLFDEEKVSHGILDGFFHPSAQRAQHEFAAALAAAYNDWQIETWLEPEPRLFGSVHVVAEDPARAAREIDRVAEHPQIVQVFLPTVTDREYGDPFYRPIFEAALRNNLVVTLHHGKETKTVLGYPRYYIEWHTTAAPQAAMNQALSMICNGLFDKYPDLKVVLLEAGVAWVPWFMWRLDHQYREMRAEVPWVKRLPSDHMRDSIRVATQPLGDITAKQFEQIVEMSGSDSMYVFATDYPHYDADSVDKVLPGVLPEDLRRKIRYENAIETYPRLAHLA